MYKKKRGATMVEILILSGILIATFIFFYIPSRSVMCTAQRYKCGLNLNQLGKGMAMYFVDLGKQVYYPQRDGQGFVATLYKEKLVTDSYVYLCPSTPDVAFEIDGIQESIENAPDIGTDSGPISYAGRKNQNQSNYPGIYKLNDQIATTPIMADDIDPLIGNHENTQLMYFLFLDGHVEDIRRANYDFSDLFDVLSN